MKIKKINVLTVLGTLAILLFAAIMILQDISDSARQQMPDKTPETRPAETQADAEDKLRAFAREHDLDLDAWPEELTELLRSNPDTEEFVLNYPLLKDMTHEVELTQYEADGKVPLLFQWDTRWGYAQYGDTMMGLSGCGPTCLSMVCMYLLEDGRYDPLYLANFSVENGYCVPGSGSAWALISEGGTQLGLDVVEIPLDEERLIRNLEAGNPIICVMGPGDFTTTGHFIVMTGYEDGKIRVNDPNSESRSQKLWEYTAIESQIRNLWVCRLP